MTTLARTHDTQQLRPGPVCNVCPLFHGCRRICEPVEELLSSVERGRIDAEDLPRLYMGMRLTNALLDNMDLLTPHQQEVVQLYYRESLQQREIAEILEISQQAVQDTLQRARSSVGETLKTNLTRRLRKATVKR